MPNTLKKVLVCGDSFCVTDPDYPGLNWTEKLLTSTPPTFELQNMSNGGDSNALIVTQLLQGLQLNPDFVILSFTANLRYEFDNNVNVCPADISADALKLFRTERYITSCYKNRLTPDVNDLVSQWQINGTSPDFELLKNYFLICFCLTLLQNQNIPFCYSLGGFSWEQNYSAVLDQNFVKDYIYQHKDRQLKINLWNHHSGKQRPYFHVDNDSVQTAYTNEIIRHIAGIIL